MTKRTKPKNVDKELTEVSAETLKTRKKLGFETVHRKALVDWTQIIANVTIAAGLILATTTYLRDSGEARRQAAEARIALFHSNSVTEARTRLLRLWSEQDLSPFRSGLPRKTIDALVDKTIQVHSSDPQSIDESLILIADFLDGLMVCGTSQNCDFETINARLGGYAKDFFCTYRGRLEKIRDTRLLPLLGDGLKDWTARRGGCLAKITKDEK